MPPAIEAHIIVEELFCSGTVKHYDQPVGVVVASSYAIAREAADKVKIYYDPPRQKPLVTVRDVLKAGAKDRVKVQSEIKASKKGLCKLGKIGHFVRETLVFNIYQCF